MKFQDLHHDEAVLAELGQRLAQLRIAMNMTQANLARQAGIGKRTLERMEAGETTQTRTFFRIFRELDLLTKLELLLPEPTVDSGPAKREGAVLPKRVPRKKPKHDNSDEERRADEKRRADGEGVHPDPPDSVQGMLRLDGF